jgi:hypothetical protein
MFSGPSIQKLKEHLGLTDQVARQCKAVMSYGESFRDRFFDAVDPTLMEIFPKTYKWVRSWQSYSRSWQSEAEVRMFMLDELLEGYGVEALSEDSGFQAWPDYSYVNMGDTYTTTIMFNFDTQKFLISDWGTIAERFSSEDY